MTSNVLVVDDEADIRELVEITLSRMGHRSAAAATIGEARERLAEHAFDLCITDMRLPDGTGIDLVQHIQERHAQVPVAVITAYGNARTAVESLKAGAFDYVAKPIDLKVLRRLVDEALRLTGPPTADGPADRLIGESEEMKRLRTLVERVARSQAPVHLAGESGSGKELVARLIHDRGTRAAAPFVPVNCGAIPGELMESEFFGHLKGAFTGAGRDKAGLFQAAEGGTLFLDEVADLPLHMQVKLLRALQERAVRPVGAEQEVPVNVRIISATHGHLSELTAQGRFRQDLFYRLNVIEVRVPPLRERTGDIPALATHIFDRLRADHGLPHEPALTPAAQRQLQGYAFPGNVRELENILERAITLSDGARIDVADLELRGAPANGPAGVSEHGIVAPAPPSSFGTPLETHVEEVEKRAIRDALEKTGGNKTKAAALLGMTFRQLRYRIKKLDIH